MYSGLKMALEMPTVMELPPFELPVSFISPLRMLGLVVGLAKRSYDQKLHRASRSIHEYHNIYSMKTKSIHFFYFRNNFHHYYANRESFEVKFTVLPKFIFPCYVLKILF